MQVNDERCEVWYHSLPRSLSLPNPKFHTVPAESAYVHDIVMTDM